MLRFSQHGRIDRIRSQLWESSHLTHQQNSSCWLSILNHFCGWQHTSLGHRGKSTAKGLIYRLCSTHTGGAGLCY